MNKYLEKLASMPIETFTKRYAERISPILKSKIVAHKYGATAGAAAGATRGAYQEDEYGGRNFSAGNALKGALIGGVGGAALGGAYAAGKVGARGNAFIKGRKPAGHYAKVVAEAANKASKVE